MMISTRLAMARVGDYSRNETDVFEQDIPISKITQHPDWQVWTGFVNDICLLELGHSADTSSQFVSSSEIAEQEPGLGTRCMVPGWEDDEDYLQKVNLLDQCSTSGHTLRIFTKISQSQRRPLLRPSPGSKHLL